MPTYAQVQSRINTDYLNRTDLSAQTKNAIQAAIRYYERGRFYFNETATAIVTSSGQRTIALPSNFVVLTLLEITENGSNYQPEEVSYAEVREYNALGSTGVPSYWAYHDNQLELALIPDGSYTCTVSYVKRLSTLSADSDTNDWLSAAEDCIVYHATKLMWTTVLRNQDVAATFHMLEQEAKTVLLGENEQRMMGKITPTEF